MFSSRPAVMPIDFPPARVEPVLHFGRLLAASRGYRDGAGAVLFPEQLSVTTRPTSQAFSVVFLDRFHELFFARVLPVLQEDTFTHAERENLRVATPGLPRPRARPSAGCRPGNGAIAARQLLAVLAQTGAVSLSQDGRVRLEIDKAQSRLREELERVRELEQACCRVGLEPAREYLRASGWTVVDAACYRELEEPFARFLGHSASRSAPTV